MKYYNEKYVKKNENIQKEIKKIIKKVEKKNQINRI